MNKFDKWVDENHPNVDNHHAWDFQQKKIDAVLSRIAEQQADYGQPAWVYLEEIKELLK